MDMAQCHNHTLWQFQLAIGADQPDSWRVVQIARHPQRGIDTQCAGVSTRDLNLTVAAQWPQNTHILHAAFRPDQGHRLGSGELAGLEQCFFLNQRLIGE
ncbi:Uncharacterised protein [Yersinia enterocolitica]|nr:Uncharacterised protein [Yersinia enterocolitica]